KSTGLGSWSFAMDSLESAAGLAPPVSRAAPIPIGRCRVRRRRVQVSTVTLVPVGGGGHRISSSTVATSSTAVASATGTAPSGLGGRLAACDMRARSDLPPGGTWYDQAAPRSVAAHKAVPSRNLSKIAQQQSDRALRIAHH